MPCLFTRVSAVFNHSPTPIFTLCLHAQEEWRTISFLAVLLALISVTASLLATWKQRGEAGKSRSAASDNRDIA